MTVSALPLGHGPSVLCLISIIPLIDILGGMQGAAANDKADDRGPTKTLFAMRDFAAESEEAAAAAAEAKPMKRR